MKGTYVLLISLGKDADCMVGSLGKIKFRKGFYAYVGSGMNSLEKRVERHFRKRGKKKFWHIDYLLAKREARIVKAVSWESAMKEECKSAEKIARKFEGVARFGCSDCGCGSHLFYSEKLQNIEAALEISRSFRAPRLLLRLPRPSASSTL